MASKTSIANMALSHLNTGKTIGNLDTEKSQEADVCRVFYDTALETILRKKDWWFARKTADFALVAQLAGASWVYSYRYPNDCLMVRSLVNASVFRNFEMSADDQGGLVLSNDTNAVFVYTRRDVAVEFLPADFVMAFSYLLAYCIAPRLTGGDAFKLGERSYQGYLASIEQAAVNAYNEEGTRAKPDSAFQQARNS